MSALTRHKIEEAILEHLKEEGTIEEGEMLGDWTIALHLENMEVDDLERHAYAQIASRPSMPPHVQQGLLSEALTAENDEE